MHPKTLDIQDFPDIAKAELAGYTIPISPTQAEKLAWRMAQEGEPGNRRARRQLARLHRLAETKKRKVSK